MGKKLQKRADRPIGLVVLVALAAGWAVEAGLAVKQSPVAEKLLARPSKLRSRGYKGFHRYLQVGKPYKYLAKFT